MGINDILQKNNPMQKKIDRENRSDFAKLVDRNTELVDEIKWLKTDNDILKGRIDKAVEFVEKWKYEDGDGSVFFDINTNPKVLLEILDKDSDK